MRSGWLAKRLGDLSELITKGTTPTSIGHSFVPEGINFVKVESISANGQFLSSKLARITADCHSALRRSQLKSGDILFSIAGALGRTALVTDDVIPANTNQALAIIRLKKSDEVLPEFVLQALSTGIVLEQIEKFKGGVAQQNLSLAQVQDFQIVIPPIPEQRRIIRILDEAFEGLARATANAEKNLKNARALFESHLDSVFVPRSESWVTHPLADCLQLITYGFTNPMPTTAIGPYMITAKNVVNGKIDYASARRTSRDAFENLLTAKSRPRIGDVLLTKDGTLGRLAVVDKDDICINQSVALLRPNGRVVSP